MRLESLCYAYSSSSFFSRSLHCRKLRRLRRSRCCFRTLDCHHHSHTSNAGDLVGDLILLFQMSLDLLTYQGEFIEIGASFFAIRGNAMLQTSIKAERL